MPRRHVVLEGEPVRAQPGFHRFVEGTPPRLESVIRSFRCDRCRDRTPIWMTDDWRWSRLPPRWHRRWICVLYFRQLAPERRERNEP